MASVGSLVVNIAGNSERLEKSLRRSESSVQKFSSFASKALGSLFAAAAIKNTVGAIIGIAAETETLSVQFEVLTGSASKASQVMKDISDFAASTPFQKLDIANAARQLLAFGGNAETVVGELKMLGDIAAATGNPIGELAELYGKAKVQGRLFGEDINQLTGRGIPVIQAFAVQFGVAEAEVKKLVEQGKVGFPELQQALKSMTEEGGKFAGMTERLAGTTAGKWSTLTDNVKELGNEIGGMLLPATNAAIAAMTKLVQNTSGYTSAGESAMRIAFGQEKALRMMQKATEDLTKAEEKQAAVVAVVKESILSKLKVLASLRAEFVSLRTEGLKSLLDIRQGWLEALKAFQNGELSIHMMRRIRNEFIAITQQRSGFATAIQDVTNELRMLTGQATEASIELERMASFGVPPAQLQRLQQLWKQRDELIAQQKEQQKLEDEAARMERIAAIQEEVAAAIGPSDMQDQETSRFARAPEAAAAMTRNSSEAFSTLVRAQRSNEDKQIKAIEKQTKAIVDAVTKSSLQMAGGGLALVAEFIP